MTYWIQNPDGTRTFDAMAWKAARAANLAAERERKLAELEARVEAERVQRELDRTLRAAQRREYDRDAAALRVQLRQAVAARDLAATRNIYFELGLVKQEIELMDLFG